MSGKQKGRRRERQYRDLLERAGFEVQPFYGRRYGETDGFGLYDLIAIRPADGHGTRRVTAHLIQVKSNTATGIREWLTDAQRHMGRWIQPEYAVCEDYHGWRVMIPVWDGHSWGYETVVDERDSNGQIGDGVVDWLQEGQV